MAETYAHHDLVDIREIARIAGTDPETVTQWMREPEFPPPVLKLETGNLWDRRRVDKYLLETGKRGVPPIF